MALVRSFKEKSMERNSLHDEIEASYTVFERDGRTFLQIDTYGRASRDMPGKKSQSLQLDQAGAEMLATILRKSFHL